MRYMMILLLPVVMLAKVHYAKVEPFEIVVLKSAVSALVQRVNLQAEGKMVANAEIIHLDDHLDRKDLNSSKQSLSILHNMLKINQKIVKSLIESLKRQKGYYERLNRLSTASKTQKDTAFNSFVSVKNQYLSTQEKIESLKKQILDMEYKISRLEDSIAKKSIRLQNKYLYKLIAREGDFVNPGSALATVHDQTRAKLTLFLEPSELKSINKKVIYIDGKETSYRVDKIWNESDEKFISSYRAEIYIPKPNGYFSRLVKVELR